MLWSRGWRISHTHWEVYHIYIHIPCSCVSSSNFGICEAVWYGFPKRMRCVFLNAKWTRSKSTDLMVQQQSNNTTSLVKLPKFATFCIYMGMVSQQGMHHCFVFTLAMYYIFDISLKEICTRQ